MRIFTLSIFYLISLGSVPDSFGNDEIEQILNQRAQAYSSHRVTGRILESINQDSMAGLRGEFINPSSAATEQIPSSWINNTREYMEYVNHRASFSRGAAENSVGNHDGPKKPNQVEFEADMRRIDESLKQELATQGDSFRTQSEPQIKSIVEGDYQANRALFEEKGLQNLYMDIYDFDEAPSRGKLRKIMEQISENAELVKSLPIPNIQNLVRNAKQGVGKREMAKDKAQLEKSRKTKFFEDTSKAYERTVSEARLAPQRKLDTEFFKKKNLHHISDLSELTDSELLMLRHHSQNPLENIDKNPEKALNIINEQRKKERNFITGIKDISNGMADNVTNQSVRSYSGNSSEKLNQIQKDIDVANPAKRYKTAVQMRMGGANSDMKALQVTNKESRLTLLDIITKDSIEPSKNESALKHNKAFNNFTNVDIKKALDRIPVGDIKAREAFVRYAAEYGSPNQLRSLKIHANATIIHMEKMEKLNLGCRR